jgi:hypothetical protein
MWICHIFCVALDRIQTVPMTCGHEKIAVNKFVHVSNAFNILYRTFVPYFIEFSANAFNFFCLCFNKFRSLICFVFNWILHRDCVMYDAGTATLNKLRKKQFNKHILSYNSKTCIEINTTEISNYLQTYTISVKFQVLRTASMTIKDFWDI